MLGLGITGSHVHDLVTDDFGATHRGYFGVPESGDQAAGIAVGVTRNHQQRTVAERTGDQAVGQVRTGNQVNPRRRGTKDALGDFLGGLVASRTCDTVGRGSPSYLRQDRIGDGPGSTQRHHAGSTELTHGVGGGVDVGTVGAHRQDGAIRQDSGGNRIGGSGSGGTVGIGQVNHGVAAHESELGDFSGGAHTGSPVDTLYRLSGVGVELLGDIITDGSRSTQNHDAAGVQATDFVENLGRNVTDGRC